MRELPESASSTEKYLFDPRQDKWVLSRNKTVIFSPLKEIIGPELFQSFKHLLYLAALSYSPSHVLNLYRHFTHFAKHCYSTGSKLDEISAPSVINYFSFLSPKDRWRTTYVKLAVIGFDDHRLTGASAEALSCVKKLKIPKNVQGEAVRNHDKYLGALSELEILSLDEHALAAYERRLINLEEYSLLLVFRSIGSRPSQVTDLKRIDFYRAIDKTKSAVRYLINVPRRKQRLGQNRFRGQFHEYALTPEIGEVLEAYLIETENRVLSLIPQITPDQMAKLPIFLNWSLLTKAINGGSVLDLIGDTDIFHRTSSDAGAAIRQIGAVMAAPSERIGVLSFSPIRFRRTIGTRAAREGYGVNVIATLLDHSDHQSAEIYTEDVPEAAVAIDKAMSMQMAPLAQAFSGVLVSSEALAKRGDDIRSRIRTDTGTSVGTCGEYGFCSLAAPLGCYTCRQFQPWLDAPHEELLDGLLDERERVQKRTGDLTIAAVNDRTIFAVAQVIKLCDLTRSQSAPRLADAGVAKCS